MQQMHTTTTATLTPATVIRVGKACSFMRASLTASIWSVGWVGGLGSGAGLAGGGLVTNVTVLSGAHARNSHLQRGAR